jgi:hypothetical protein
MRAAWRAGLLLAAVYALPAPLRDGVWDDGQAEISTYRGTIVAEGHERALTVRMIAVKEEFDLRQRVKAETGSAADSALTTTAIKLNVIRDFTTGAYSFHQMSSVFYDRATLRPLKLAMSSADGCGITYVEVLPEGKGFRHRSHSYFQDEADRELSIEARPDTLPVLLWDGLPLWLRTLDLETPQHFEIRLLPSQVSPRVQAAAFVPAGLQVFGADTRGLRVRVSYRNAAGRLSGDTFWFRKDPPHVLERLERGDGTVLELVDTQRLAYWTKTAPEDTALVTR